MLELRRSMRQRGQGGGKSPDPKELLERVEKARAAMRDLEEEQNAELKKILTPEQMLSYMAFEEMFRREMQQMLRESRGGRGGGPGMEGPGGRSPGGPGGMDAPRRGGGGKDRPGYPSGPMYEGR